VGVGGNYAAAGIDTAMFTVIVFLIPIVLLSGVLNAVDMHS